MERFEVLVTSIVEKVMEQFIKIEASGRHVHLDRATIDLLFGKGYQLTKDRDLSQPGQFVCKERVTIEGPKGKFENVVILGPERKESQVEVSLTDAISLGIKVPIRESGNITGTPPIILKAGSNQVELPYGVIVAKRHIHMSPEDAQVFNLKDQDIVQVKVFGKRPLIFDDVLIRVSPRFHTYMHIDYDEGNACGFVKGTLGMIIKGT